MHKKFFSLFKNKILTSYLKMSEQPTTLKMDSKHPNVIFHKDLLSDKPDEYFGSSVNRALDVEKSKYTFLTPKDVAKMDQHGIPGYMNQRKRKLIVITDKKTSVSNSVHQDNIMDSVQYHSTANMEETKFQLDDRDFHSKPDQQPIVCSWDQKAIFNQLRNQTK